MMTLNTMKHLTVLISIIVLFSFNKGYTQEISKDTIYIEFNKKNTSDSYYRGYKFKSEKGINFNLEKNGSVIFLNEYTPDTLTNNHLSKYPITKIEEIGDLG